MASLLSSLIMGNSASMLDKDKEQPATPPAGGPAPQQQSQPALPSIPPMANPQPQAQQSAPPMPQGMPGLPNIPGLPQLGFDPLASLSKGLAGMPTQSGAGMTPKIDVNAIDNTTAQKHAAGLDMYLRSSGAGKVTSGAGLISAMQSWLNKTTNIQGQTAGAKRSDLIGDDNFLKLIDTTAELYNTGDPTKRKMADAYANGVMYLTTAYAKNDQNGVTGAKDYLAELMDYTDEDFRNPKTATYVARQAAQVIKPYVTGKSIADIEAEKAEQSPEAVRKKLIGNVLYDYVQGRFTELRTAAQSGSPDADAARTTLNVFEKAYGDLAKPTIEGNRDKQVQNFMDSAQGSALIDDAYEQFDGQGLFNTKKSQDLVKRMGGQLRGETDPTSQVTPQELKDFFGQTRMKRYVSGAINLDASVGNEAALRFDPANADDDDIYRGLTPGGVKALYGQKDGALIGDMSRAGREDPYMYDISSNISGTQTNAPTNLTGANTSRIATRAELAGAMASGLNLSEAQLEQVGRKLFTSTDDVSDFVTAGLNAYDMESDILPKVERDIKSVRTGQSGGLVSGGTSTGTYNLITDTFKAVDEVIPGGAQQKSWMNRKRVLNDVAVQARNLEGTAAEKSGLPFAKLPTGENDYNQPLLPDRGDQITRIQVLQGMFDQAGKNARYRTDLQNLIKSYIDGVPYRGNIKMTPQQLSSLVSVYAKHLEEATFADKNTDAAFQSLFDIKASDYSKKDLRFKILRSLQAATPSRFRTMASTMEVTPEGATRYIPTTTAGTVMENASAIPGDTGGKGGRSSKTERTALDRVQRSIDIVNNIFTDAKNSILNYTNNVSENAALGKAQGGNFKADVVKAFDDSIAASMKKYEIKAEDKPKFDRMITSIKQQLLDTASTEWMKGTVTDKDIDDLFKQFRPSATSISALYAGQTDESAPTRVSPSEETNRAQIDEGRRIYNEAVAALGGNLDGKKAPDAPTLRQVIGERAAAALKAGKDDYANFLNGWEDSTNKGIAAAKRDADIQAGIVKNANADIAKLTETKRKTTNPTEIKKIDQAIVALGRRKQSAEAKGQEAITVMQGRMAELAFYAPSEEDYNDIMAGRKNERDANTALDLRYRSIKEKIRNQGFAALPEFDKRFFYEQGLVRRKQDEENTIGVGKNTRLGFNSFLASNQGVNWTVVNPDYELIDDNARAPQYLVEVKDGDGKTVGHRLNENVKFQFVWRKDAKTNRFSGVDLIATESVKQGDNTSRPIRKQKIETGLENVIYKAKNFELDLNATLKQLDASTEGKTYGRVATETRVNRGATKLSSAFRDLLDLTSRDNLNDANKDNVAALRASVIQGLRDAGRPDPEGMVDGLIKQNISTKALLGFADTLRTRIADRVDAFAGKGSGRVRTPQEIQDDISKYFGTNAGSQADYAKKRQQSIEILTELGLYEPREVTDADGKTKPVVQQLPADVTGTIITELNKRGKVALTTSKDDVAGLRNAVMQKLKPLQVKLQTEVDSLKQGDAGRVAKIAEAKKLSGLAGKINAATNESELSVALLDFDSSSPIIKGAKDVVRSWTTRKDVSLSTAYSNLMTLRDKASSGNITDVEKKRLDVLTLAINKHLRSYAPELGSNGLNKLIDLDVQSERLNDLAAVYNAADDKVPFKVIFGESAKKLQRINLPTVSTSSKDLAKYYKDWQKKLNIRDKKRLAKELDILGTIQDVSPEQVAKYKFGDVWRIINKRWESMSPKQWIEYTYSLPDDARKTLLTEFPTNSSYLPEGEKGEGSSESWKEFVKRNRVLTLTPGGHVVPAKNTKTAPQWVKENRLPGSDRYAETLEWKIQANAVEYLDILHDSLRTYQYEVKKPDGSIIKTGNADLFTTEGANGLRTLKKGFAVTGASYVDSDKNRVSVPVTEKYGIGRNAIEVPIYNRSVTLKSRMIPASVDFDVVDKKLIKKEPIFKRMSAEIPTVQQNDRIGFEYEGKRFWIGRADYRQFVERVNKGEISSRNLREVLVDLIPRLRTDVNKYPQVGAKARGGSAPDEKGIKIPEDVQDKLIAQAEAAGQQGLLTKAKNATRGMSFLAVLMMALKEYGKDVIRNYQVEEGKSRGK